MYYLLIIFILGLLILVHEFGHFLAARRLGVPVQRFSIGFGPVLWSKQSGAVTYCLSAVPLGGYVMLGVDDEIEYLNLPLRKKIGVSLGGLLANLLLVLPLYALMNTLSEGLSVYGLLIAPFPQTAQALGQIFTALGNLFQHGGELSGIVGIVSSGSGYIAPDPLRAIGFTILISLNLAVFNLLPLPPLDGGKIILDLFHRLFSGLSRVYIPAVLTGWLLILGLMVYVTVMDVSRLIGLTLTHGGASVLT